MDQVYFYLGQALYYGLMAGFVVTYVWLLGYFLWHKLWLFAFLSIAFTAAAYTAGAIWAIVLGPPIVLVVGWQEAAKWKAKNLVRVFGALWVICFILLARDAWTDFMKPKPKVDPAIAARQRAQAAAKAAIKKQQMK